MQVEVRCLSRVLVQKTMPSVAECTASHSVTPEISSVHPEAVHREAMGDGIGGARKGPPFSVEGGALLQGSRLTEHL